MPIDLHQRGLGRLRFARRSLGGLALLGWLAAGLALPPEPRAASAQDTSTPARGADGGTPQGPRTCTIDGRASFREVRVRREGRRRTIVSVVSIESREISVEALTPTLFRVRTRMGEPAIDGETRERPPITLRREVRVSGMLALRGTPILRLTPRDQALAVDLGLGDGVIARHVVLPCDALRVRASEPPQARVPSPLRSPRWRARAGRLLLREREEEGIEALRVFIPAEVELHELARAEGLVRVMVPLTWGRLDGWVRDTDLAPRTGLP